MAARPRAVVALNPAARRAGAPWEPLLRGALAGYDLEVVTPGDAADTTRAAREAVAAGATLVVAAGGDGTASAAAAGVIGTDAALGLFPLGTANDFARALGVPRDPAGAAARLAAGRRRAVDVIEAAGRPVCTVAGLGIVARSALAVGAAKRRGGLARAAAQSLGAGVYRLAASAFLVAEGDVVRRYAVSARGPNGDRRELELDAHGVFVANQRVLGGGLTLPSGSVDDDGVAELCFVSPSTRLGLGAAFARLSVGAPIPHGVLTIIPVTEATIRASSDEELLGDGDGVARGREFRLVVRRRALNVVV